MNRIRTYRLTDSAFRLLDDIDNFEVEAVVEGPTAERCFSVSDGAYGNKKIHGSLKGATFYQGRFSTVNGCSQRVARKYKDSDLGITRTQHVSFSARATTGRARANYNIFNTEVEGPSAGARIRQRSIPYTPINEAEAMVELSAFRAGAAAGPVFAAVNLNCNTGGRVGINGVECNILGFGFSIGSRTSVITPIGTIGIGF